MSLERPLLWTGAAIIALVGLLLGLGALDAGTALQTMVLLAVMLPLCWRLTSPADRWLWWVASLAYVLKLSGSALRYLVLVDVYEGSGDAGQYHAAGLQLADVWRSLTMPTETFGGSFGTEVTRRITGLVYVPYEPSMLGGFFEFATLAFLGQLLFYAAFRRSVPEGSLRMYAGLVLFLPSMLFWPSSIGKDSPMLLFLGLATYAAARTFEAFRLRWVLLLGAGAWAAALIRPHVAALWGAAFAAAVLLGRAGWGSSAGLRRTLVLAVGVAIAAVALSTASDTLGVSSAADVDPLLDELERRTQQGGSAVEGEPVQSPADLPEAVLRVLFSPLPHEAHNLQAMVSAAEAGLLLALLAWRTPRILANLRRLRRPALLLSWVYTLGFVVAFSSIFNLGILARQRIQVLPFLLAILAGAGWDRGESPEHPPQDRVSITPPAGRPAIRRG